MATPDADNAARADELAAEFDRVEARMDAGELPEQVARPLLDAISTAIKELTV